MRSPSLLLLAAVLGVAASNAAASEDLPQLRTRGTLRVVVWKDNLPELFAVKPGAEASGLEQELLQGFANLHKLKIEVVAVPELEDRVPALLAAKGDLIAGGFVDTPARRQKVNFSTELFPIRHVVVTRKPHAGVDTITKLREEKVGTVAGSSWADEVKAAGVPEKNVDTTFRSADDVLAGLKSGKVSAVVMSAVWAAVAARKDPALELGLFLGQPTSVGYAVRKDQPQLLAALDDYVTNVRRTPTWSRLVVKYFGESGLEILRRSR
jgi:ABC-type amino acid transport substrate-binding protein